MAGAAPKLIFEPYYREVPSTDQKRCSRGHICWCPCLYFKPQIQILNLNTFDPHHKNPTLFQLDRIKVEAFQERTHKPLVNPPLGADEELLVFTAKRRPVIILSSRTEVWQLRDKGNREECYLVAPIFSFHEGDDEVWKARVWAYYYRELFYLPEDKKFGMDEGMVRFDRLQVVPRDWLSRSDTALTEDVLCLFTGWFQFYVTGLADELTREIIFSFREESMAKIEATYGKDSAK